MDNLFYEDIKIVDEVKYYISGIVVKDNPRDKYVLANRIKDGYYLKVTNTVTNKSILYILSESKTFTPEEQIVAFYDITTGLVNSLINHVKYIN